MMMFPMLAALAAIQLVAPKEGATVAVLTPPQKAFIAMDAAERKAKFRDKKQRPAVLGEINKRTDKGRLSCWPAEVKLAWKADGAAEYRVTVKRRKDGAVHFEGAVKGGEIAVDNLEAATDYEWTVNGGGDSGRGSFRTEEAEIRPVRFPGVPNVRDLGGAKGLGGRRIRQGLIFRSFTPQENAKATFYTQKEVDELKLEQKVDRHGKKERVVKSRTPGKPKIGAAGREYLAKRFGIRTDIDLRNGGETYGQTNSPFGASCRWAHHHFGAYGTPCGAAESFKAIFRLLLDEKNYPVDFHCYAGQDRTGMLAFILEGLLGASEDHLLLDWQMTGFWNPGIGDMTGGYDNMLRKYAEKYPGVPLQDAIVKDVLKLGFTMEDVEKFRSIMLEK